MLDYFLLALSILLIIIGIIGCLVPVLPGPPLSFAGLLVLHLSHISTFSNKLLIILGVTAGIVTVLDYVVPIWGTKKFGGSKYGTWGAALGLLIGLFFGPPGIIFGPFIGAVTGEMMKENNVRYALKAGFGALLGFLTGVGLKLAASLTITFYFIRSFII